MNKIILLSAIIFWGCGCKRQLTEAEKNYAGKYKVVVEEKMIKDFPKVDWDNFYLELKTDGTFYITPSPAIRDSDKPKTWKHIDDYEIENITLTFDGKWDDLFQDHNEQLKPWWDMETKQRMGLVLLTPLPEGDYEQIENMKFRKVE